MNAKMLIEGQSRLLYARIDTVRHDGLRRAAQTTSLTKTEALPTKGILRYQAQALLGAARYKNHVGQEGIFAGYYTPPYPPKTAEGQAAPLMKVRFTDNITLLLCPTSLDHVAVHTKHRKRTHRAQVTPNTIHKGA